MPTAQEFRTASSDVVIATESVATMYRLLDRHHADFGFSGTTIAETVADALIAGSANMSVVGQDLVSLITELNRKALLCEQFTLDLQTYERLHTQWTVDDQSFRASAERGGTARPPGREPLRPEPPFPGAQAG